LRAATLTDLPSRAATAAAAAAAAPTIVTISYRPERLLGTVNDAMIQAISEF
jgi:hypothetical protein